MKVSDEMKAILLQIKQLVQKKDALNDAFEIKTINKEINVLQEKYGQLKEQRKIEKIFKDSLEREYDNICNDD